MLIWWMTLQGFNFDFKLIGNESERYFQIGNSVPVTIVNEIGKELIKIGAI